MTRNYKLAKASPSSSFAASSGGNIAFGVLFWMTLKAFRHALFSLVGQPLMLLCLDPALDFLV